MLSEELLKDEQSDAPVMYSNDDKDEIELDYMPPTSTTSNIGNINERFINAKLSDDRQSTATHPLSGNLSIKLSILFILFGFGPSWILLDAMFVQLPYFQQHQPESSSLASKMTVSGAMTLVTALPLYFIIINIMDSKMSFRKLTYILISAQIICCLIIALFWDVTIGNVSIIIYLITYISSFIGHLQTVAIIPWVTSINNNLTSQILTGSNLGSLLVVVIALIQKPGSENHLFTPSAYFMIIIVMFVISLLSLIYLDKKYIKNIDLILKNHRTLTIKPDKKGNKTSSLMKKMISTFSIPIWWKSIYKYAILNAYIQLISWIFVRSTIPYAAEHTTLDNSTNTEQYAIELSYVAVLIGSALSLFISFKQSIFYVIFTVVYSILALIFLIIVIDDETHLWIFKGSNVFVVVLVFLMRFIDGYLSPIIYNNVAKFYPNRAHEMNQWIGAIEKISTFIGVWLTYTLVQTKVVRD